MKNFKLVSATLIVALFALAAWTEPTQPVVKKEITQEVSCLDVTTEELTCEAPLVLAT
ncbi:MAG: hypothetical protein JNJ57_19175, partial [Saprospiraceae bacterium]|nr:hypothetical protein [Saprospiraceae bacterium]